MAKSVKDLAQVMSILMQQPHLAGNLSDSWEGVGVGFVDPEIWQPASFVTEPREDFKRQTVRIIS